MINYIYILLKLYPDRDWNWGVLYRNRDITPEIILELFPLSLKKLSLNPNMTPDLNNSTVLKIIDKIKERKENKEKYTWNYNLLNKNMRININSFKLYPDFPWNYHIIAEREDTDLNLLEYCINFIPGEIKVCNRNITWDFFTKHRNRKWDMEYLISSTRIKCIEIINNPDIFTLRDYTYALSANININWEIIDRYPDLQMWYWPLVSLCMRCNVMFDPRYKKYWQNNLLIYYEVSINVTLTWRIVKQHLDLDWDWYELTKRFGTKKRSEKYPQIKEYYSDSKVEIIQDLFRGIHSEKTCEKLTNTPIMIKKKYWDLWRRNTKRNITQRNKWKIEYGASINFLNLYSIKIQIT